MTSRPFSDFPRNEQGLVDNFIGTAYDTVKRVGDNLPEIGRLDDVLAEIPELAVTTVNAAVDVAMVPAVAIMDAKIDEASGYATAAQTSAETAAVVVRRFLAPSATMPITRDDGNPLQQGDRFFNTTDSQEYVYEGAEWKSIDFDTEYYSAPEGASRIGTSGGLTVENRLDAQDSAVAELVQKIKDGGRYVPNLAALRALNKNENLYANTLGYYSAGDQGGGTYWQDPSNTTSADNGGSIIVATDGARWRLVTDGDVSVRQFGARGDGAIDDTAAVLAAYNFINLNRLWYTLRFPTGRYVTTSQFVFKDFHYGTFVMEGCIFIGASPSAAYDSILKIENVIGCDIVGNFRCSPKPLSGSASGATDATLYDAGMVVVSKPGGAISAAAGICAYFDVYGYKAVRCKLGLRIGEYNNDAKTSEITFHGYQSVQCSESFAMGGSQTVVTMNSPILSSNNISTYYADSGLGGVTIEGGALTINGGQAMFYRNATGPVFSLQPCQSGTFGNLYGTLNVNGTLIEATSRALNIRNPRALDGVTSYSSMASFRGSYGYLNPPTTVSSFVCVDPAYVGKLTIDDSCTYYRQLASSPMIQPNVDFGRSPGAKVEVGKHSFQSTTGFFPWESGVLGGILVHSEELAVVAFATGSSLTAGSEQNVVFNTLGTGRNITRYSNRLSLSDGTFTVPSGTHGGAPRSLSFEATFSLGVATTGSIRLMNVSTGENLGWGTVAGGIANLKVTVQDPVGGHVYAVKVTPSAAVTFGGTVTNRLSIKATG